MLNVQIFHEHAAFYFYGVTIYEAAFSVYIHWPINTPTNQSINH